MPLYFRYEIDNCLRKGRESILQTRRIALARYIYLTGRGRLVLNRDTYRDLADRGWTREMVDDCLALLDTFQKIEWRCDNDVLIALLSEDELKDQQTGYVPGEVIS